MVSNTVQLKRCNINSTFVLPELSVLREGITNYTMKLVWKWEWFHPKWDSKASLESNVLAYVFGPKGPGWNSNLTTDENVDKILSSMRVVEPDESIGQNVVYYVADFMWPTGLSSFSPKVEMAERVVEDFWNKFLPGVSEEEPIGYGIEKWIHSHDDLKGLDGKE